MVQILQCLLLASAFVANAHELIEKDGALFFSFQLVGLVFAYFALHQVAHLRQFGLTLRLQAFNEVRHLDVLIFSHT